MSDDADERERAEAEALARALEAGGDAGDEGDAGAPEDALETAALLRYGARDAELRPERADAVLAKLLPRVDAAASERTRQPEPGAERLPTRVPSRRFVPMAAAGVLAVAAAAWLVVANETELGAPPVPTATSAGPPPQSAARDLPSPPQRLLAAQAALAGDEHARDPAAFDAEMQVYRERVLRALERAYPARTGMLELRSRR